MEQIIGEETIVAVSTPPGMGGIAVIRVSGNHAIEIVNKVWKGKSLVTAKTHTAVYGHIWDPESGEIIDECLALVMLAPKSFTGENTVEISCHGSKWIQRTIVNLLIRSGARSAGRGEFSQRAFMNGKIDLAQAEGIADLISASSKAAHRMALNQAGGKFSERLESLRDKLINLASLLELELDFSEEEVEFADRKKLLELADEIINTVNKLAATFEAGSAFKEGVEVVIAGLPNAGKSTLLNALIEDDKAIVSEIPGTTRDTIEDTKELGGILFRFVDTAGLRESDDTIENIGIQRARKRISSAPIIIWVEDSISSDLTLTEDSRYSQARLLKEIMRKDATIILFLNKGDLKETGKTYNTQQETEIKKTSTLLEILSTNRIIKGSALTGEGLDELSEALQKTAMRGYDPASEIMVTNARHYECLIRGSRSMQRAKVGLIAGLSSDLIAQDIRETIHHLGTITGTITTDTLLQTIFTRFCIGK